MWISSTTYKERIKPHSIDSELILLKFTVGVLQIVHLFGDMAHFTKCATPTSWILRHYSHRKTNCQIPHGEILTLTECLLHDVIQHTPSCCVHIIRIEFLNELVPIHVAVNVHVTGQYIHQTFCLSFVGMWLRWKWTVVSPTEWTVHEEKSSSNRYTF